MNCLKYKPAFIFILLVSGIMLSGCARTYNITKYNSQADYYRDFNSSVTARKVTVELKDSSVISPVSAVLMSNDTLFHSYRKK